MKKPAELDPLAPRPNLDFSKGVSGKYFDRMQEATNIALIAPDLSDAFPDSESVKEACAPSRRSPPAPKPRPRQPAPASR